MIVIASNNGWDYLETCVERCLQHTKGVWPVTVVDTFSSDEKFREFAKQLCEKHNLNFIQAGQQCWDFGAYKLAFQRFPTVDKFWFQHDSVWAKTDFIQELDYMLTINDIVPWMWFLRRLGGAGGWDNQEQKLWLEDNFGTAEYQLGVYGPNLGITRQAMELVWPKIQSVSVTNKTQQMAMERAWSILIDQHGLRTSCLEKRDNLMGATDPDDHDFFCKAPHRNGRFRS